MPIRLTPEQLAAAVNHSAFVFVEAAPGSGKTAVAAERFGYARFVTHRKRPVVCVSFTRAATAELRNRIVSRWGSGALRWPHRVKTFDGFHREILEYLLRRGAILWPGGHESLDVIDTWRGEKDARWKEKGSWARLLAVSGSQVVTRSGRTTDDGYVFGAKGPYVAALSAGKCTHDEVRHVIDAALRSHRIRPIVLEYLRTSCAALIVDEFFDADETDLEVVAAAIEAGSAVSVIGDPWQAIYEFRGARPDLARKFIETHVFEHYPIEQSFRFKNGSLMAYARSLRASHAASLLDVDTVETLDVALAARWFPLWGTGPVILPLSFGPVTNLTDALLNFVLDAVVQGSIGERAVYWREAISILGLDESEANSWAEAVAPVVHLLSQGATAEEVFACLRQCVKDLGSLRRIPKLKPDSIPATLLMSLGERVRHDGRSIPGMTTHQAKGREWNKVGVVLDAAEMAILRSGLDPTSKEHRVLYVSLTRARHRVGWLRTSRPVD